MESTRESAETDPSVDRYNPVFSLRCRACEREKPYGRSDIVDFDGLPTARFSRSRAADRGSERNTLYRAANG
jgi:hypothetical protein